MYFFNAHCGVIQNVKEQILLNKKHQILRFDFFCLCYSSTNIIEIFQFNQIIMREISIIKKNILQYLDYKGVTKYEFYQKTGVSNGILSQSNGISEDNILKFLSYYSEINVEWLLTGKGSMLKGDEVEKAEEDIHLIPLYGGEMTASLTDNTMDSISQPIEMINAGDWFKDGDCAMRVYGDSMSPNYTSGSVVVMKEVRNKALILPGEDYMVETSEYRVLKRLQKSEVKGCVLACSTNEEVWERGSMKGKAIYEPFDIFIDDITRLYLILGTVRRNHN
jgi:SOS-response transcriptional repressor LexA